ncbi:uncharacterized protein LOC103569782 isoform X1 [Microplitis demolitor]|uniref:uncharacterized protein LOC103569782 isoform X1 n=1 Tax=Microplitis demolitor TaxID=69319 RepID=UPI0004CD7904|nr:uncharacterized protein LOC103569782 isoform X1 [Microplitis demolitor]XP_008545492.1 uncharacterized protein LOC103569782 isoform X1 [Microplitis demolitor]
MIDRIMKQSSSKLCVWFSGILLLNILTADMVAAGPEPESGMVFSDSFPDDTENFVLVQRLKQIAELKQEIFEDERELSEAQLEIQAMLEAKARNHRVPHHPGPSEFSSEDTEILPVAEPRVNPGPTHSGKRTSYMALCHFKICNMGRKRQL